MAWDIYIYIIRVASLQQGEKIEIEIQTEIQNNKENRWCWTYI